MSKKCAICNTENGDNYLFCKNCGTILQHESTPTMYDDGFPRGSRRGDAAQYGTENEPLGEPHSEIKYTADPNNDGFPRKTAENRSQSYQTPPETNDEYTSSNEAHFSETVYAAPRESKIFGIDERDMREYIGKNSEDYIRKFRSMEIKGSKSSWNWPFFLFSFLLGLPFTFFFHRKMYKLGSLMLALFLVINTLCAGAIMYVLEPVMGFASDISDAYIEQYEDNHGIEPRTDSPLDIDFNNDVLTDNSYFSENRQQELSNAEQSAVDGVAERLPILLIALITELVYFIFKIVMSIFADNLYLRHILKDFEELNRYDDGDPMRRILMQKRGGICYGASVSLSIALPIFVSIVLSVTVFTMVLL